MTPPLSRRALLARAAAAGAALALPGVLHALVRHDPDSERLEAWTRRLRDEGLTAAGAGAGRRIARVGELAQGTPYEAGTLEGYLREGGVPEGPEPLTLSLTRFDCVTLVESCLGVARVAAAPGAPDWTRFGAEIERMRYRGGVRGGYPTRLHYFSDWIRDNAARGLVRDLGAELGGEADRRPLRFMSEHRASYPALRSDGVFAAIAAMEQELDAAPRFVVGPERIPAVLDRIESGDILAFATAIPGLDVTHAALAHRGPDGVLRVLHAPLSGGVVQITTTTLPEYVAAIRHATGIMVARSLA